MQRSLSLAEILNRKEFVARRRWRSLNWKIIILVLFVHVLANEKFFSNQFHLLVYNRSAISLENLAASHS